jgi:hypothetical protein
MRLLANSAVVAADSDPPILPVVPVVTPSGEFIIVRLTTRMKIVIPLLGKEGPGMVARYQATAPYPLLLRRRGVILMSSIPHVAPRSHEKPVSFRAQRGISP